MKKLRLLVIMTIMQLFAMSAFAQSDLSSQARRFRSNMLDFLREEGFTPTTTNEGKRIEFRHEGTKYWIDLSGTDPVKVMFCISGYNAKDANTIAIMYACNKINRDYYYVKAYVTEFGDDGSVNLSIEMPCHSADEFRHVFHSCVNALEGARAKWKIVYDESVDALAEDDDYGASSDDASIELISCSVANVESGGDIISNFGAPIYSYKTKYLKPRIKIDSNRSGTFKINYKLYTPDGTLSTGSSSPEGYSVCTEIEVKKGMSTYQLDGWGSKVSGNWEAGNYKLEIYVGDKYLGRHTFTIK